ncbi:rod shape-determining protein RodA [bacterium]|jgi:rod shape determining protein RodA|nr:rod shape-determining protein RodA [bacterium]MDP6571730.1 rod shape-determining protein RodA [Patescibacteria group bacterium]MDP6756421.1 rod shape-determining protein RodA [Patescibacteria group bacterium]|tara:strand:+ start:10882 stop:11958 length:1077 start_codon:yes stop_codon:yes gene_type:complete
MKVNLTGAFARIDWWVMGACILLVGSGLLIIYSLTWPEDTRLVKQIIFLALGLALVIAIQLLDVHFWRNASVVFYAVIILLLIGLLIFGDTTRGIKAWITIGSLGFQPAEFAKLAMILFLATTLERLHFDIARLKHVVLVFAIIGIPMLLIAMQPDVGSAFIIFITGTIMILYTGLDRKKLLMLLVVGLIALFIGWFGVLQDYQKDRVLTFLNPQSDLLGAGYNVAQSVIAIGSGGIFGRGLGLGTQSQLNFLPEQETDFIFASFAEELGFLGSMLLLLVFVFFLWRLYRMTRDGTRLFGNFLILGILAMFLSQAVINIGMNMGLFPVTGVPLPFISYGGSSLIASFASIGIAMNVKG